LNLVIIKTAVSGVYPNGVQTEPSLTNEAQKYEKNENMGYSVYLPISEADNNDKDSPKPKEEGGYMTKGKWREDLPKDDIHEGN
jgi:hypothetical protein